MGSTRRMRRAEARRRRREWAPTVNPGPAPGLLDIALPIPPGMSADEARALAAEFAAELGLTVSGLHVCTPETCTHLHTPTPTHE